MVKEIVGDVRVHQFHFLHLLSPRLLCALWCQLSISWHKDDQPGKEKRESGVQGGRGGVRGPEGDQVNGVKGSNVFQIIVFSPTQEEEKMRLMVQAS